jgi:hypothetical protein
MLFIHVLMKFFKFFTWLNVFSVTGLDEEGLFRLTAGSSKVRRLRAEIEAGQVSHPQRVLHTSAKNA